MKKHFILTLLLVIVMSVSLSGCLLKAVDLNPEPEPEPTQYTVTIDVAGNALGNKAFTVMNGETALNSGDKVDENAVLTIACEANDGFTKAVDVKVGEAEAAALTEETVTVTADTTITATFTAITEYSVDVLDSFDTLLDEDNSYAKENTGVETNYDGVYQVLEGNYDTVMTMLTKVYFTYDFSAEFEEGKNYIFMFDIATDGDDTKAYLFDIDEIYAIGGYEAADDQDTIASYDFWDILHNVTALQAALSNEYSKTVNLSLNFTGYTGSTNTGASSIKRNEGKGTVSFNFGAIEEGTYELTLYIFEYDPTAPDFNLEKALSEVTITVTVTAPATV